MPVAPGISVRKLPQEISIFDLAAVGASGFQQWAMLAPVAQGCRCEIETAKDGDITPGYDALNRAWLVSALLLMRGYGRHLALACSSYSWGRIAGHQSRTAEVFHKQAADEGGSAAVFNSRRELPEFEGNLLDFHTHFLIPRSEPKETLTQDDAQWINKHFEAFNRLAAESEKFRFALEAAVDWRFSKNPRIALARIWSGIEALFGITSEIVFRVSLLCAFILEERGDLRLTRFQSVKKLYGIRSKAVHGDDLDPEKLSKGMSDSFELLKDLLLKLVERGSELSDEDIEHIVFH